jgi:hypothetical protein
MTNEQQRLEVTNNPGSGTFKLGFRTEWATSEIPRHPAAGDLQDYLESITTIGTGNVAVSKESNWVYIIDYQNELSNQDVPELMVDYTNLPAGATVIVTVLIEGEDSGAGPPSGDPQQDAINLAYSVLVKSRHRGPFSWPAAKDHTLEAIEALYPFQTVETTPEVESQRRLAKEKTAKAGKR